MFILPDEAIKQTGKDTISIETEKLKRIDLLGTRELLSLYEYVSNERINRLLNGYLAMYTCTFKETRHFSFTDYIHTVEAGGIEDPP